jgi:predicted dienelactone hydrolase
LYRIIKAVVAVAIVGVATLFIALWIERRTAVTLPSPTGPFAVGRTSVDLKDESGKRELLVWIWYPAEAGRGAVVDEYLPAGLRVAVERTRGPLMRFLTRDLSKVRIHSLRDANLSPQQLTFPVVMMRGGASVEVWNYSTLAEDLASHGYVVVGFDAPYRTNIVVFPDGRTMRRTPENNPELVGGQQFERRAERLLAAWTADMAFVLDRLPQLGGKFAGRLDMNRVGVFGHSFGGAQAAQFCHDDPRCKAGIDIDGAPLGNVIQTGMDRPFMFLLSDHHREPDAERSQIMADIRSIYDRLPANQRFLIAIRGANHFLFNDDLALLKSHIVMRILRIVGLVGIDGRRQLGVTTDCIHRFFDACLKGQGAPRFDIPEIENLANSQ